MAEQEFYIGTLGPYILDDVDDAAYLAEPGQVLRTKDLPGSTTVVTETAFGQASSAGTAQTFSRGDHTHGTPAAGLTQDVTIMGTTLHFTNGLLTSVT